MWLLLFPALCLVAMSAYSKTEPLATEEADAIEKGNHSLAAGLLLAWIVFTVCGTAVTIVTSLTGFALCMLGMAQPESRADLRILLPVTACSAVCLLSAAVTTGDPFQGYVFSQTLCPVLLLLAASLGRKERTCLRGLCLVWSAILAAAGIAVFLRDAAAGAAGRTGGIFGNANVMGIFLVISWFALADSRERQDLESRFRFLLYVEPLLLYAAALTLSMGSYAAMAAGILVAAVCGRRDKLLLTLAKAVMGTGAGLLLYIAAVKTSAGWLCGAAVLYMAVQAVLWDRLERFLALHRKTAAFLSGIGVLVAVSAVALRPNAAATFTERLEMMENGLHYIATSPLWGTGPLQWHLLNLFDPRCFKTWYIHNMFIHVGVELGVCAMFLLVLAAVLCLAKRRPPQLRAGLTALFVHYVLDVGFAYTGLTAAAVLLLGTSDEGKRPWNTAAARLFYAAFAVLFVCGLLRYIR